ncbi:UBX domain-containing protein 1-like isoform X2 [Dysidea avara]|uniref:UBX domain-containing protein 1-like isoform X2 n=1 Tax=Dysidea avara TaxID=196820 RepID=UPI003327D6E7
MDDILSCIQTLNGLGEKGSAAVELINKYTSNILDHPTNDKYRRIRIENARFNSVIWSLEVARNLMYALGFEQEGSDYLVLPEDVDLSLIRDVFVKPVAAPTTVLSTVPAQKPTVAPSLRLGKTANDQSYFDSLQPDMTLLSYLVEMGYDREIGQRALVATGNKGVQPAMDWISVNPHGNIVTTSTEDVLVPTPTANTEDVPVKPKPSVQVPVSRYESTAADRHAFQEKKRKEQILATKIAKKEEIAAKKILLASVEAEKKSRQGESTTATVTEQNSKPQQPTASPKQQSSVALIKLRMPNGEVSTLQLEPSDTVETLYQHASETAKTLSTDLKLLSPTSMEVFSDKNITLEEAGLTPRGLIVVRLISQETEDPR